MGNKHIFNFYAPVNDTTVGKLIGQISEAIDAGNDNRADEIIIELSSMGGYLNSCFTFYQYLRSISDLVAVTAVNLGNVESAALIMYLAADRRLALPYSKFGIHQFAHRFEDSAEYSQMVEQIAQFDTDVERYCGVFAERTQGAEQTVDIHKNLHGIPWFPDAQEAVKVGIAQQIVIPQSLEDANAIRWRVTG